MAEIGLLDPRVLNGVIQEFEGPESLLGHELVGTPLRDIQPTWEYDIIRPSRGALTTFNAPNAEARVIDQLKIGHMTGGYAYIRDKKMFTPTALRWLRRAGQDRAAARNAEAKVLEELTDMRTQHMRGEEIAIWKMFQGEWTYNLVNGTSETINYRIPSMHKPNALSGDTAWGGSADDPIGNIQAWKRVVERDSGFPISYGVMNNVTMSKFIRLPEVKEQLSDRQKDRYTTEGIIPRFFGIDWREYDAGYVEDDSESGSSEGSSGLYVPYIPDNVIIFYAFGGTSPWRLLYGPSADDDAPATQTGPYVKSWSEPDPSGRQVLMEVNFMPALFKPNQLMVANIGVTP